MRRVFIQDERYVLKRRLPRIFNAVRVPAFALHHIAGMQEVFLPIVHDFCRAAENIIDLKFPFMAVVT